MSVTRSHSPAKKQPSSPTNGTEGHHGGGHIPTRLGGRSPMVSLGMVQRKVVIGPADGPFEHEANRVADHVVGGQMAPPITPLSAGGLGHVQRQENGEDEDLVQAWPVQRQVEEEEEEPIQTLPVQRQAAAEEEEAVQTLPIQRQVEEEEEPIQPLPVQRQVEEEEDAIQTLPVQRQVRDEEEEAVQTQANGAGGGGSATMRAAASQAIHSRGAGQPLQGDTRARLEGSLGVGLGHVRVHTGQSAEKVSQTLRARAFTHGHHIWLGRGESPSDLRLMAHETTHVLQQRGVVQRQPLDEEEPAAVAAPDTTPGPAASANGAVTAAPGVGAAPPTAAAVAAPSLGAPVVEGQGETAVSTPAPPQEAAAPAAVAPSAPAAAPTPAPAPAPAASGGDEMDALLPAEPAGLSEADQANLSAVQGRVGETAVAESNLPAAETSTAGARGAVEEPTTETAARAQSALVGALDQRPEPSAEIEKLCKRISEIIHSKRPPNDESLVEADPQEMANQAGEQLNQSVEGDSQRVQGEYNSLNNTPEGTPQQQSQPAETPPQTVETPAINAETAAPTPIPEEELSSQGAVDENQRRIDEAGMNTEAAQEIQDGPVAEAREAQGELEEEAQESQAAIVARQEEAIATARNNMGSLQEQALSMLNASRREAIGGTSDQQGAMVNQETVTREQVSTRAQAIYTSAQERVNTLLEPLSRNAMQRWNTGKERLARDFQASLAKVDEWIEERHSGVVGFFRGVVDSVFGYPAWVVEEYNHAEEAFGDGACALMREISTEVNGIIATCEEIIANANREIDELFNNLPADLQEWANGERTRFQERLNSLGNNVREAQNNINQDLMREASQAVQQVREEIHGRRQAARGLIGRIADAISAFLDDPVRAIINGLLSLVGIEPSRFWALASRIEQVMADIADDPKQFANNLMSAIGQGFDQFFDRFKDHLFGGFFEWLFSGLGSVGVEIPTDFSLKSIITFVLQLMGISWAKIRRLLAKHIGEENVALIEKAWELVSTLIEQGPQGIFEMIKEQLNPQELLNQIINAAIDFMVEALIKQVAIRVALLFNPVGAIAQAIQAIYKVLKWIFENAARIFSLIETVVNGIADIIAGNIGGMANAVEQALRGLIAPVIDFLMGLLGLGDLPDKIAKTIKGFQDWIESILDRVIGWLAEQGRKLLRAMGIGEKEETEFGDVRDTVRARLTDLLREEHSLDDVQAILAAQLDANREHGLTALYLSPEAEDGSYEVIAEASPPQDLLTVMPKVREGSKAAVRTLVRITLASEDAAFENEMLEVEIKPSEEEYREYIRLNFGTTSDPTEFIRWRRQAIAALTTTEMVEVPAGSGVDAAAGVLRTRARTIRGVRVAGRSYRLIRRVERARHGRSEFGGAVFETDSNIIDAQFWSVGQLAEGQRGDNATHAEVQFMAWYRSLDASVRRRVTHIHVQNDAYSPCWTCSGQLVSFIRQAKSDSDHDITADIVWDEPYLEPPRPRSGGETTPNSLASLARTGWQVTPASLPSEGAVDERFVWGRSR